MLFLPCPRRGLPNIPSSPDPFLFICCTALGSTGPARYCTWGPVNAVPCLSRGLLSPAPRQGGLLNMGRWQAGPDGAHCRHSVWQPCVRGLG